MTLPAPFILRSGDPAMPVMPSAVVVAPVKVAFVPVAAVKVKYGKTDGVRMSVEVAVKYWATTWPTTLSFAYGLVVAMPTLPEMSALPALKRFVERFVDVE